MKVFIVLAAATALASKYFVLLISIAIWQSYGENEYVHFFTFSDYY